MASILAVALSYMLYSAIRRRVEPNWPAPAYVGGVLLIGLTAGGPLWRKWLRAGFGLATVLTAVVYIHAVIPMIPVAPARDPVGRAFGWDHLAREAVVLAEWNRGAATWFGADRYQEASEIAFHTGRSDSTLALNLAGRRNQYDLWPGFPERATQGDGIVLALGESEDVHESIVMLEPHFESVRRGPRVELRRGDGVVGVRRLYLLSGWNGGWPRPSSN
jgi:hypothetical protein